MFLCSTKLTTIGEIERLKSFKLIFTEFVIMATNDRKMVSTANHFSNLDYLNNLNKYIPSLVLEQLIKKDQAHKPTTLPELQKMETVVVFADISGFTNLSEACAKKGDRGNEELAFCINRYMEGMVTNLN